MELHKSPKIFENYKSDHPIETINRIQKGFKSLNLEINYRDTSIKNSDFSLYSGFASIDILGWSQEGKGFSKILSKASAYAELAERFSIGLMDLNIPLPKNTGRYKDLLSDLNKRKFLKGYTTNCKPPSIEYLKKYFHKDITYEEYEIFRNEDLLNSFVDGYNIQTGKYKKLPLHVIELTSSSNGSASGNTIEEAVSQASFEIFERYAACKIINEKIPCNTIDINSIENEEIRKCIDLFESLNFEIIIKDFTFGNSIPVIGVLFVNHNLDNDLNKLKTDRFHTRIDVGSHLNLDEAIMRAFTELKQTSGADKKEILEKKDYDKIYDFWTKKLGKNYNGVDNLSKYLTVHYDYFGSYSFLKKGKKISYKELNSRNNHDCLDDVNDITDICKKNNWKIFVIDYTHKILQFPTVRVVIPSVSTNFDIHSINTIRKKNLEERINYFFGIKDFHSFITSDKWLNEKKKIKKLIKNIEEYLSKELIFHIIKITRENNYTQSISLFHILPFLYLAINDYVNSKKYFEFLLDMKPDLANNQSFIKSLFFSEQYSDYIKTYIGLINDSIKEKRNLNFKLKKNPFDSDSTSEEIEEMYVMLLKKINDSYL